MYIIPIMLKMTHLDTFLVIMFDGWLLTGVIRRAHGAVEPKDRAEKPRI